MFLAKTSSHLGLFAVGNFAGTCIAINGTWLWCVRAGTFVMRANFAFANALVFLRQLLKEEFDEFLKACV
jgi:hypothetical protein